MFSICFFGLNKIYSYTISVSLNLCICFFGLHKIYVIVQVWSNDAYETVEHRVVVNSEKERLSIPILFNPSHYTIMKPLDELINEQNPAKYRAYNWGKYFTSRLHSNLKKLHVENLQIYHFKVQESANKLDGLLSINK